MHNPLILLCLLAASLHCALSDEPELVNKRSVYFQGPQGELYPVPERRTSDSSFVRFGRSDSGDLEVSQPHTRSDIIIRFGRDGSMTGRLNRLRQERIRRLARLALLCKSQDEVPASSAEEKILKEICRDAPLHPTVPDFV